MFKFIVQSSASEKRYLSIYNSSGAASSSLKEAPLATEDLSPSVAQWELHTYQAVSNIVSFSGTSNTFALKLSVKLQENNFLLWNQWGSYLVSQTPQSGNEPANPSHVQNWTRSNL